MTAAEEEILAVMAKCDLRPSVLDGFPPGLRSALVTLQEERIPAAARGRFLALYRAKDAAQRAFEEACDALPRAVMLAWYQDAEKALKPASEPNQ